MAARAAGEPAGRARSSSGSPPRPATPTATPLDARPGASCARKGVDLLVLNDVSGGAVFGEPHNEVHLLTPDGAVDGPHAGTKSDVAHAVWDRVHAACGSRAA